MENVEHSWMFCFVKWVENHQIAGFYGTLLFFSGYVLNLLFQSHCCGLNHIESLDFFKSSATPSWGVVSCWKLEAIVRWPRKWWNGDTKEKKTMSRLIWRWISDINRYQMFDLYDAFECFWLFWLFWIRCIPFFDPHCSFLNPGVSCLAPYSCCWNPHFGFWYSHASLLRLRSSLLFLKSPFVEVL